MQRAGSLGQGGSEKGKSPLVWLPASQVWARAHPSSIRSSGMSDHQHCNNAEDEGVRHQVIAISSDSDDDSQATGGHWQEGHQELPHCPICEHHVLAPQLKALPADCAPFIALCHPPGSYVPVSAQPREAEPWLWAPAGLTDILDPKDKAVLDPCCHVFCQPCVHRWLQHKKLCPLCKVRELQGRDLGGQKGGAGGRSGNRMRPIKFLSGGGVFACSRAPAMSRRESPSASPQHPAGACRQLHAQHRERGQLQAAAPITLPAPPGEAHQPPAAPLVAQIPLPGTSDPAEVQQGPPGHWVSDDAPSMQLHARAWALKLNHCSPANGREVAASQQPRPYYWRVQRACNRHPPPTPEAPAALPSSSHGGGEPTPIQRAILWRRRVYAEVPPAAPLPSLLCCSRFSRKKGRRGPSQHWSSARESALCGSASSLAGLLGWAAPLLEACLLPFCILNGHRPDVGSSVALMLALGAATGRLVQEGGG